MFSQYPIEQIKLLVEPLKLPKDTDHIADNNVSTQENTLIKETAM